MATAFFSSKLRAVDVVQSYYHDGEAAYLMQADVKKLAAADAAEDASEEAVLAA